MNKRNSLLQIRASAVLLRLLACAGLLLALNVRAVENTNQASQDIVPAQTTNSSGNNDTNQMQNLANMPIEDLMQVPIVTASKFEQKASEAPAQATVITSDEIRKYGWRTLGDILESVPGFYISYDRDYQYVGVSGVNLGDANNRILVLVNGHRINDDLNDSAAVDTSFILDVDLIDRVEIIRGPGSVLYGNNAFFAVINVITRQGKQVGGAEGSGAYGSYDTASGRMTIGNQFTNGLQYLLSGTLYNSHGVENLYYPEFQKYNNGIAHNMDAGDFQSFFGSVNYSDFTLEGGYINRDKLNPTSQYGYSFNDPQFETIDQRSFATLKYQHNFAHDWDVLADVYYDSSYSYIGQPMGFPVGAPPIAFDQQTQQGRWTGLEVQVNKKIFDKDTLTFGGEYRNDFTLDATESGPGIIGGSIQDHRQSYGVFGQGDVAVQDNLHLEAGARYDQYGNYSPDWSPRAALIYNAWKDSTFKLIYGTAFRDPDVLELALSDTKNILPEKIYSYQLVYDQGINKNLSSSVMGYYNHMNDLIGLSESGTYTNFNADTLGLEVALNGKWLDKINARLSYSLQRTANRDTDVGLPDSPENMIKLNVNTPLYKDKIFAGLEVQYTSQSKTMIDTFPEIIPGPNSPGYTVINFTLFSHDLFVKNLELSAGVYNLLDAKYYEPASDFHLQPYIQQDGINFRVKLTYRF